MADILVVDDDHASREAIQESLERDGHKVAVARGGPEGIETIRAGTFDVIVSDLVMPGADGLAILDAAKDRDAAMEVVILTGFGSVETAVDAMKRGAYQYLNKPVNIKELREVVRKALEKQSLARDNAALRRSVDEKYGFESIVGRSPVMLDLFNRVRQIAPTSVTALISGASGTGKELIAHAIHNLSPRRAKPFFAFNCGALTESLIESELFGHERGSFTGAVSDRKGYFQLADGGTLFLDEIGDMPLPMQVKLLRALETRAFFRVGGVKSIEVDVRVVAATNRDLEEMIRQGLFREDLYFRLKVVALVVPPLSARREDIPLLLQSSLEEFNRRHGKSMKGFDQPALDALARYAWPGNVRELRNLVENLVITVNADTIALKDLPENISGKSAHLADAQLFFQEGLTMEEIEREAIRIALSRTGGNKTKAAESLKMSLRTFHRKVKEFGL